MPWMTTGLSICRCRIGSREVAGLVASRHVLFIVRQRLLTGRLEQRLGVPLCHTEVFWSCGHTEDLPLHPTRFTQAIHLPHTSRTRRHQFKCRLIEDILFLGFPRENLVEVQVGQELDQVVRRLRVELLPICQSLRYPWGRGRRRPPFIVSRATAGLIKLIVDRAMGSWVGRCSRMKRETSSRPWTWS